MKKAFLIFFIFHFSFFILKAQHYYLYGETKAGGNYGKGTLFRFDPFNKQDTVLFSFNGTNGLYAATNLYQYKNLLFGVTEYGGTNDDGTIFSYNLVTKQTNTSIVNFNGTNGRWLGGRLTFENNLFYGSTGYGGVFDDGVIYSLNPVNDSFSVVFNFNDTNGKQAFGNLFAWNDTTLIGMTGYGGTNNIGVIYSFNPITQKEKVLFDCDYSSGGYSQGGFIKAPNGLLYGIPGAYGNGAAGTLISFDPVTNIETTLISFTDSTGYVLFGNLFLATDGLLYGLATTGGKYNNGTMFSYDINSNICKAVINFDTLNGSEPDGADLIEDTVNKILFGMTSEGGGYNAGVIFSYNLLTHKDSVLLNFNGTNGANSQGTLLLIYDAPKPVAQIQQYKDTICSGSCLCFADNSSNAPTSWRWFFSGTNTDSAHVQNPCNICYTAPGKYRVMLIAGNAGGSDTTFDSVLVITPAASVCCNESIIAGQSAQLIADGGSYYTWSPPGNLSCDTCPNPVASPAQTTVYTVTINTDKGCIINKSVTIDVTCEVFIPNAFSPAPYGSGRPNGVLYVRGECIATMDFMVFDRWGNKVFESQNLNQGWDGTFKGQAMNTGTYMWYLKATMLDGTNLEKKGNVALIR